MLQEENEVDVPNKSLCVLGSFQKIIQKIIEKKAVLETVYYSHAFRNIYIYFLAFRVPINQFHILLYLNTFAIRKSFFLVKPDCYKTLFYCDGF